MRRPLDTRCHKWPQLAATHSKGCAKNIEANKLGKGANVLGAKVAIAKRQAQSAFIQKPAAQRLLLGHTSRHSHKNTFTSKQEGRQQAANMQLHLIGRPPAATAPRTPLPCRHTASGWATLHTLKHVGGPAAVAPANPLLAPPPEQWCMGRADRMAGRPWRAQRLLHQPPSRTSAPQ